MDSLRGPINPFEMRPVLSTSSSCVELSYNALFSQQQQQMTFLQLLHGAMEGETEEEEARHRDQQNNAVKLPPFQLHRPDLHLLLHLQQQRTPALDAEQLESCVTNCSESENRAEAFVAQRRDNPHSSPTRERKKRKRSRAAAAASKSKEEVESQRMTHIAVERNRRRLMNDHLAALRAIMPPSLVQRGDQASIIGGAIEFVKQLEQHLIALESAKRVQTDEFDHEGVVGFFVSPQYTTYSQARRRRQRSTNPLRCRRADDEVDEEVGVDVEATLVQGHVSLKVATARRDSQLVRAIAAMDELRLSVLHLNINTFDRFSVLYSFNLKIEEECKLGSADEIATVVQHIFSYINSC